MKTWLPILCILLSGCATASAEQSAEDLFFRRLHDLCGQAFEGRVVSPTVAADAAFAGKRLVMHVRDCRRDEVRIPFHVGEDRSRTWIVTRAATGLKLKHDHRHSDGTEDRLTQYGGNRITQGTARRQEFPADEDSKTLFLREGIAASTANVWAVEVEPGRTFAYELRRPGRFFRAEFDLARPIAPPEPPWDAG